MTDPNAHASTFGADAVAVNETTNAAYVANYDSNNVTVINGGTTSGPIASLSKTSLSFGNQLAGSASTPQTVTLTNSGTASLTISSITTNPGVFSQTNNCGGSVAVGASCTVSVTFSPTVTGAVTGSLNIADNAAGSPQVVGLTGTGVAASVALSLTSLNFGNQVVGTTSAAQSVTLTNTGSATVLITSITTSLSVFSQSNTCGSSVAVGANCTISLTFTPTGAGTSVGTLTITDNAPGSPQTVSLTGTGVTGGGGAPAVTLSPTSLNFGSQNVGTTSTAKVVTPTNTGTAALTISTISTSLASFGESNNCPLSPMTLAAGITCSISVTFAPSSAGTFAGTLTISDDASGSPHTVSLTGTGVNVVVSGVTVLHSFTGPASGGTGADGANPYQGLARDASGNLYGTTYGGGDYGYGIVFELINSSGSYTEKVLYSFGGNSADGQNPTPPLLLDSSGNLYGTTINGGAFGGGIAFELVKSSGGYTEKILYAFGSTPTDGISPSSGLITDSVGNFYGTTWLGGDFNVGTVFELVNSSGNYTEKVLHSFDVNYDGRNPSGGLLMDAAGNLFGTTMWSGGFGLGADGSVLELVNSSGSYTEKLLCTFSTYDSIQGFTPEAGLIMDASGNLYGTTSYGGTPYVNEGTVFELVNSSGDYTLKVLYSFGTTSADGLTPSGGLVMDSSGNLYGTTLSGGAFGSGTIYELVNASGSYTEKVLYNFGGTSTDAQHPYAGLVMDPSGNLYGTTVGGGANGLGTVFEINPNASVPAVMLSASSLTFSTPVGATSSPQPFKVTNIGTGNLIFGMGAVALSGSNAGDFAVSGDTCSGATVAPGATCSVNVTFTPSLVGSESATLNFTDNALSSPQTATLTGTGVKEPFITSVLPPWGYTGQTITDFTVNGGGFECDLVVSSTGGPIYYFSTPTITFSFGGIVASVVSCSSTQIIATITIGANAVLATRGLTVTNWDSTNATFRNAFSVEAPPSGTPIINLSAASLDFGIQPKGTTGGPQTLTLKNAGTGTLTISSITPSAGFEVLSTGTTCSGGASLAPATSCDISLGFTPDAIGPVSGSLAISDNAADSPQRVALAGAGMAAFHQCDGKQGLPGVPAKYDNGLVDTCLYGCALTSSGGLLTTYKPDATPESLDTFLSQPDLYSPSGSGDLDFSTLHLYLSAIQLVDSKDQTMQQADTVSYLKQEVLTYKRRVILRLQMSSCD